MRVLVRCFGLPPLPPWRYGRTRDYLARWQAANPDKVAAYQARYRLLRADRVKASRDAYKLKDYERSKNVYIARALLNKAVKRAKVLRPTACSECGAACTPHGHHPDYDKPYEVIWLCRPCHASLHRRIGRGVQ